jgi:hypothetical protein
MNVAVNVALIAIAAQAAQQRKLVQRLHDEGATVPERAQPVSEDDARLLKSVVDEGIVREAAPGVFYVDAAKYAEWTDPRRDRKAASQALAVLLIVCAVAAFTGLLAFLAGR